MLIWAGWALAAVLAAFWALREWRIRGSQAAGRHSVDDVNKQLDEALALASRLTLDHDAMRESVERERKRADEYFAIIDDAVAERDARMKLYYEQATEHGAAQAMLLRQLESLVRQYQHATNGKMPKLNPAVEAVTREFRMNHVEPARDEKAKSQQKIGLDGG